MPSLLKYEKVRQLTRYIHSGVKQNIHPSTTFKSFTRSLSHFGIRFKRVSVVRLGVVEVEDVISDSSNLLILKIMCSWVLYSRWYWVSLNMQVKKTIYSLALSRNGFRLQFIENSFAYFSENVTETDTLVCETKFYRVISIRCPELFYWFFWHLWKVKRA